MLHMFGQFSSGKGKNVHYSNEIITRSNLENCDANCQKTCCKYSPDFGYPI